MKKPVMGYGWWGLGRGLLEGYVEKLCGSLEGIDQFTDNTGFISSHCLFTLHITLRDYPLQCITTFLATAVFVTHLPHFKPRKENILANISPGWHPGLYLGYAFDSALRESSRK